MHLLQVSFQDALLAEHPEADGAHGLSAMQCLVILVRRVGLERSAASLALLAWIKAFI